MNEKQTNKQTNIGRYLPVATKESRLTRSEPLPERDRPAMRSNSQPRTILKRFTLSPQLLSKAIKIGSRILRTVSPIDNVKSLLIGHYYYKNTLENPCNFNYSLVIDVEQDDSVPYVCWFLLFYTYCSWFP